MDVCSADAVGHADVVPVGDPAEAQGGEVGGEDRCFSAVGVGAGEDA